MLQRPKKSSRQSHFCGGCSLWIRTSCWQIPPCWKPFRWSLAHIQTSFIIKIFICIFLSLHLFYCISCYVSGYGVHIVDYVLVSFEFAVLFWGIHVLVFIWW